MKQLRIMLFLHQDEWIISPLNAFQKLLPFSNPTTCQGSSFIQDQEQTFPWVELNSNKHHPSPYSLILLINVKIENKLETLAIGADAPPKIIEISEDNVHWLDNERLLVQLQQPQSITAKILDEKILTSV